jgi:hypothetical protein
LSNWSRQIEAEPDFFVPEAAEVIEKMVDETGVEPASSLRTM